MKRSRAFSPGHITGFFQIFDDSENPLEKGSRGAGVSVERGVTTNVEITRAKKTSIRIQINGHPTTSAIVSEKVVADFLELVSDRPYLINIEHEINLPIGCGFGISGAGALSLALALNEGFELGLSRLKAAQIAHIAEVKCKTGLGSVIAEFHGGIEIRIKSGGPGVGEIQTIPSDDESYVFSLPFGPLSTARFLTNEDDRHRINELGGELTDSLICQPSLSNLLNFSRQFAEHIQLITARVRRMIQDAEDAGIICSTAIFGENVFSIVHKDQIPTAEDIFRHHLPEGHELMVMKIDEQGARVING